MGAAGSNRVRGGGCRRGEMAHTGGEVPVTVGVLVEGQDVWEELTRQSAEDIDWRRRAKE